LVTVIIWLILSVCLCPKVITLSGFHWTKIKCRVRLLVVMAFSCLSLSCLHFYWVLWVIGSFPHFCQFNLCCNLINWQHILVIQESFCAFSIWYQGSFKDSKYSVLQSFFTLSCTGFLGVLQSFSLRYKAIVHIFVWMSTNYLLPCVVSS
jgi:hypothetical protein